MGVSLETAVIAVSPGTAVTGGILGTAVMGGTRVEIQGRVVTMTTGTVAQRAETKTPEARTPEPQTLHTGDYSHSAH